MAKEIYPSSYVCDCGQESHHFERTIRDLKKMSLKEPQVLIADDGEHEIIFEDGEMVAIWCPKTEREMEASNHTDSDDK